MSQALYGQAETLSRRTKQIIPRELARVASNLDESCGEEDFEKARISIDWINTCPKNFTKDTSWGSVPGTGAIFAPSILSPTVACRASDEKWSASETEMNKLSPRQQAACDVAKAQRRLCRDWLIDIMTASSEKTRTKADLRAEAIARFKVSKSAFDFGWMWAIEDTGNHHSYEPLPRSRRKKTGTMLT
jgi:hypothetical protein